jgi:GWxTD domain-containing protein
VISIAVPLSNSFPDNELKEDTPAASHFRLATLECVITGALERGRRTTRPSALVRARNRILDVGSPISGLRCASREKGEMRMRPPLQRAFACGFLAFGIAASVSAATLPELFQKVKQHVSARDWTGAIKALEELDAEAARPENEQARAALRPAAAFYRGVCLAATDRPADASAEFALYIAANSDKGIDHGAYPKKVIAAFEEARRAARPDPSEGSSPLGAAFREVPYPSAALQPPSPEWAQGPLRYLLSPEEIRTYSRIGGDLERAEFVARFWLARDPFPETPENEFRREFERRVAFADEKFSEGSTRGSLTDRGMVFVMVGPPSGTIRRPLTVEEDASPMLPITGTQSAPPSRTSIGLRASDQPSNWKEIWTYRRNALPADVPYQQVDFVFVTRIDYGKNVLQRDVTSVRTLDAARPKPRS